MMQAREKHILERIAHLFDDCVSEGQTARLTKHYDDLEILLCVNQEGFNEMVLTTKDSNNTQMIRRLEPDENPENFCAAIERMSVLYTGWEMWSL